MFFQQETFVRAQMWLKELEKQYIPGSTVIWLVGNKGDLAQDRQVSVQVNASCDTCSCFIEYYLYLDNCLLYGFYNGIHFSLWPFEFEFNTTDLQCLCKHRKDRVLPKTEVWGLLKHRLCLEKRSMHCCLLWVSSSHLYTVQPLSLPLTVSLDTFLISWTVSAWKTKPTHSYTTREQQIPKGLSVFLFFSPQSVRVDRGAHRITDRVAGHPDCGPTEQRDTELFPILLPLKSLTPVDGSTSQKTLYLNIKY